MKDEKLILAVKQGDARSFEVLVEKYRNNAVLFAYQYTKDFHLAEDMVQEAFVKLYLSIDKLDLAKASVKTFLFTIIKRKCIDLSRKKYPSFLNIEDSSISSLSQTPEEISISKEEYKNLEKYINSLEQKQREALLLREYGELSYVEIAKVMKKSVANVKSYIFRSRKKLLELFRKEYDR